MSGDCITNERQTCGIKRFQKTMEKEFMEMSNREQGKIEKVMSDGSVEVAEYEDKEFITVTRTIPVNLGGTGEEEVSEEHIEIRPFVSEVARVRIGKGLTLNLGNYQSARIDVDFSFPCYPEEFQGAIEFVNNLVEARLIMERDSIIKAIRKDKK